MTNNNNATQVTTNPKLKSFVDRITTLEGEKKDISNDIKEVYLEAKSTGFDVKALRRTVRDSMKPLEKLREEELIAETYRSEVGIEVFTE